MNDASRMNPAETATAPAGGVPSLAPTGNSIGESSGLLTAGYVTAIAEAGTNELFGRGARRTDNNRVATLLLMLNYKVGSGILNTPQTFRDSGLAASAALYLVAGKH